MSAKVEKVRISRCLENETYAREEEYTLQCIQKGDKRRMPL